MYLNMTPHMPQRGVLTSSSPWLRH